MPRGLIRATLHRSSWRLASIVLLAIPSVSLSQGATDQSIPLALGETRTQVRAPGEATTYTISVVAGQAYLIEVHQAGLDFIVAIRTAEGDIRRHNSPLERIERELVLLEPRVSGSYDLTIFSNDLTEAAGTYSIRVSSIDTASADASSIAAWRLMTESAAANAEGSLAAKQTALAGYEAAARLWQTAGSIREQAQSQLSVAALRYMFLYDPEICDWFCSAAQAAASADLYDAIDEPHLAANANLLQAKASIEGLNDLGREAAQLELTEALSLLADAQQQFESSGTSYELAQTKYFIGLAHSNMGDPEQATRSWREAAEIFAESGEWLQEAYTHFNIAVSAIHEGYVSVAIDALQEIIDDPRNSADPLFSGAVLDNLAAAHREAGNIDAALQTYAEALEVHRKTEDAHGEAASLIGIGSTYFDAGELRLASEYTQQAMVTADEAGEGRVSAMSRMVLGNIAFINSDYELALQYHRGALDRTSSAIARSQRQALLAADFVALNQHEQAVEMARQALATAETVASPLAQADARLELGRAHLDMRDLESAAEALHSALRLYESIGAEAAQADVYHELALAARDRGDLPAAETYGQESLDRIESLRERVAAPQLRAFYTSARRGYYETQIELLIAQDRESDVRNSRFIADALTISERSRARMTMDLLNEAAVNLYRGVDPELARRRNELFERLADLRLRQDRLLRRESPDAETAAALEDALERMADVENALNLIENRIRASNPSYAGVASVGYLDAHQIQRQIDDDSVLLQYALGDTASFVWIVTSEAVSVVALADRSMIEAAARLAYEQLKAPLNRARVYEALRRLSSEVLEPVAHLLDEKRVLIAADGALQYIPFPVLPVSIDGTYQPLIATREVVLVPSMSVVASQRQRVRAGQTTMTLAVFADPIFSESDPRLATGDDSELDTDPDLRAMTLRSSIGDALSRLKGTGYEADILEQLVPEHERLIARGFGASRERLLAEDLGRYRYIHLATHGLIDSEHPALSALVLSRFDAAGQPQDGLLRLHDVYNLNLSADLVVLSACETALGMEIRGEALVGLTQGFMYAGARSLIVSLWPVADRPTAELMTRFYRYLLEENLRPADALRRAQLSIAAQRSQSDPYYWGGFVLMGEWL